VIYLNKTILLLFGLHSSFIGCLLLNGLFPKKRRKLYLRYLWLDLNKTKTVVMIWIHYFFRQIFVPAQNGNKCGRDRHRIGGALRCLSFDGKRFGVQTMRVPVGRVPQIKHTCEGRKIPFIKNACNNFEEKKNETNPKRQKL
jgi:hypothetical protein